MAVANYLVFVARHKRTRREREFYHPGPTRRIALDHLVQLFPDWTFYL